MTLVRAAQSAMAVGGLIGALRVSTLKLIRPRLAVVTAIAAVGVTIMFAIGVNRMPFAIFPLAILIGGTMAVFQVPLSSELMRLVPDDMRGRVFGSFGALTDGMQLVSMAGAPTIAVYTGIVPVAVGINAGLTAVGLGGLAVAMRAPA